MNITQPLKAFGIWSKDVMQPGCAGRDNLFRTLSVTSCWKRCSGPAANEQSDVAVLLWVYIYTHLQIFQPAADDVSEKTLSSCNTAAYLS